MHPRTKTELLASTYTERARLEMKLAGLTQDEILYPGCMGEWSVKDILQHLVDWEQRWIGWYNAGKRGEAVVTPEPGYNWREMGKLNEKYRLRNIVRPLQEVLDDFHTSYHQIMSIVENIPEEEMLELGRYSWTGKLPLIAWIAGNTCQHYQWAIQMIRPRGIRRKLVKGGP